VLSAFGIPWAVVCDGAAFATGNRPEARHIFCQILNAHIEVPELTAWRANAFGNGSGQDMSPEFFADQCRLGEQYGVLTLASGWQTGQANNESFEAFLDGVDPEMLVNARAEVGESKVRMGRWIAENVTCPARVASLYPLILVALQTRGLSV
jgi:hypothetical protein